MKDTEEGSVSILLPKKLIRQIRVDIEPESLPEPRKIKPRHPAESEVVTADEASGVESASSAPAKAAVESGAVADGTSVGESVDESVGLAEGVSLSEDVDSAGDVENPGAVRQVEFRQSDLDEVRPAGNVPEESGTSGTGDISAERPTYYWTCKLVQDGMFGPDEIVVIRQIDMATYWEHLQGGLDDGLHIPLRNAIEPARMEVLVAAVESGVETEFDQLRERVPAEIGDLELMFFLQQQSLIQ